MLVRLVAFLHSITAGIIVVVFFILYQQLENHVLQPVVYGRTVQLSPLIVLISVLIGAELAGVIGALAAIPTAGSLQVVLRDWLEFQAPRAMVVQDGPDSITEVHIYGANERPLGEHGGPEAEIPIGGRPLLPL